MVVPPPAKAASVTKYLKPYLLRMNFSNKYVMAVVFHTPSATVAGRASSIERAMRETMENTRDVAAAAHIGRVLAERLLCSNIPAVAVHYKRDQRYHGKVKALVDSLRESGIKLL